jgi:uncharacterized protein
MEQKINQNRRSFIKKGIVGAAGAAIVPSAMGNITKEKPSTFSENKMVYRKLGKTGIDVPIVSMGAGDTNNKKLLGAALDSGIKLLATSEYYGNGQNEKVISEVIKGRKRDSFLIMTSANPQGVNYKEGLYTEASTKESFLRKFDGCLERLDLDYIDIFLLPFAAKRESIFFKPLLSAMEEIKASGKAKYVGIATHSWESEAIRAAVETQLYDVVMTAYNFKHQNNQKIKEAIAEASSAGMGIIAMKTMAGAYWDKEKTQAINTKAALKWVLNDENVHTTVPGVTSFDQLQQNIGLMNDLNLSDEEKSDLKLASRGHTQGVYCQQCGQCVSSCVESLDIPTAMRSYMYAYGYRNLTHAKQTIEYAKIASNACSGCLTCNVNCPMGFDVKEKISDIKRLADIPGDFLA